MRQAILASGAEIVTVSLRRQAPGGRGAERFWEILRELPVSILPNTAGCRSVKEAVTTARLARELFGTAWIKLEVIGDELTLQPDPFGLVEAAALLAREGFEVFPYTTEDAVVAERLVGVGCRILMPWGSPIGSGRGLGNRYLLERLRARYPDLTLIVDAGLGRPSHAAEALEMGYDGVLLNTAVATSREPVLMAEAFAAAVRAGRAGFEAGLIEAREKAEPSTPVLGTPFWNGERTNG
jgi:thiazole synthase